MARLFAFSFLIFIMSACSSIQFGPSTSSVQQNYQNSESLNFDWPVDRARLTQYFKNGSGKRHWGIDLAAKKGTPIYAAEHGRVIYRGSGFRGYGKMIIVEHNKEWATLYSHFSKFEVQEGQWINKGDLIGRMGATGNASGVHLHFEVRHNKKPVDPIRILPRARNLASSN